MKHHAKTLAVLLSLAPACLPGAEPDKVPTPVPTRMVTGDLESYIADVRSRLAINSKDRGPFGLFQEPGKEPKQPLLTQFDRPKKTAQIPFQTIVDALPVAAVVASEKMFMIGPRSVSVGQILPLVAGGRTVRARVESVRSSEIVFRNMADNDVAVKRLDLLPDGVRIGGGGSIRPPGVIPDQPNVEVPLELDLGLPPESPDE